MGRFVVFLACVLAMLIGLVGLIGLSPEAFAAKKKVLAPSRAKPIYEAPMTVAIVRGWSLTCEPTCPEWISAEGEITGATPAAFARAFKAMGKKRLPIVIRSPGGSINAAVDIGRMIRKRGLDVAVGATSFQGCAPNEKTCKLPPDQNGIYRGSAIDYGGFCNSACPLILASGKVRLAAYGTTVGVHQPKTIWTQQRYTYRETYRMIKGKKKILSRKIISRSNAGTKVTFGYDKRLRSKLTSFFREMGVATAILADSDKASFQNMNALNGQRLNELRLRTAPNSVAILTQPSICKSGSVPSNCITGPKTALTPKPEGRIGLPIGVAADDKDMTFTLVRDSIKLCEPRCPAWIAADGVITAKTPGQLESLLKRIDAIKLPVVFNSRGGDVDAAIRLGAMIRERHVATIVGETKPYECDLHDDTCAKKNPDSIRRAYLLRGRCNGACVLAFSGGERRAIVLGSVMMVHAPRYDGVGKEQQNSAVRHYLHFGKMGISNDLMLIMNGLANERETSLDSDQQGKFRLITEISSHSVVATPGKCVTRRASELCFAREALKL